MNTQLAVASAVENNISGSEVKQYYFFDCGVSDCQVLFREISTGGSVVSDSAENNLTPEIEILNPSTITVPGEPVQDDSGVIADSEVVEDAGLDSAITSNEEIVDSEEVQILNQVQDDNKEYTTQSIRINEVVSAAETGEKEWVELYNTTLESVDLQDWTIEEGGGTKTILSGVIESHGYLVFETKNLNNSGDLILLKDPTGKVIDQVVYGAWNDGDPVDNFPATAKGESLSLYEGEYVANPHITKGQANIFERIEIVDEPQTETTTETEVVVTPPPTVTETTELAETAGAATATADDSTVPYQYSNDVLINEFLPAPATGSTEWIELYNAGSVDVDLRGWTIDDAIGGSAPYVISESLIIKAKEYLVFPESETKIQLNNTSDDVRLLDPDQKLIDSVSYTKTQSNVSWSKVDDLWVETAGLTQGLANAEVLTETLEISSAVEEAETQTYDPAFKKIGISEATSLDLRTQVMIEASVTVVPGTFSKNVIYVQDETGGIQVYFSTVNWPQLDLGRDLMITGTISQSAGEKRILIKNATDIFVKETTSEVLPFKINTGMISPALVGSLVELEATLFEKDGSTWFMTDPEGGVKAYLKQGSQISSSLFSANDKLKITGVLVQNNGEFMIQPRKEQDIVNLSLAELDEAGTSVSPEENIVAGTTQKNVLVGLGVGATVLGAINLFLAVKKYLPKRKIRGYWYRLKTSLQS